jgi:putative endonuclease
MPAPNRSGAFFMYTVYVLYSKSHSKIYIGFTSDLNQRVIAHNHIANKGWTRKYKPWILIYFEDFDLKSDAMNREKQLKSFQGRKFVWQKVISFLEKVN